MNPYNKDGAMFLRPRKFVQSCKKKWFIFKKTYLRGYFFYMMFLSIQIFIKPNATFFSFSSVVTGERHLSIQYVIKHSKRVKKKYSDITIIRYLIVSLQKNSFPPWEKHRISISTKNVSWWDQTLITRDFCPHCFACSQKFQHLNCLLKHICTHYAVCTRVIKLLRN